MSSPSEQDMARFRTLPSTASTGASHVDASMRTDPRTRDVVVSTSCAVGYLRCRHFASSSVQHLSLISPSLSSTASVKLKILKRMHCIQHCLIRVCFSFKHSKIFLCSRGVLEWLRLKDDCVPFLTCFLTLLSRFGSPIPRSCFHIHSSMPS